MAKILIVDDSETVRTQLRKLLEDEGHSIVEAYNGVNGLEVLDSNKDVHLIFCDVNMPEMDGLTMCSHVHANPEINTIPIFMLSTEASSEMKVVGKKFGVVAWAKKPYVPNKLIGAVKKVLNG